MARSLFSRFRLFGGPTSPARPRPRSLALESLEVRRNYVVFAWPTIGVDYSGMDETGVVMLTGSGGCTGTLLSSGRHVLTAAHCVTDDSGRIDSPLTTVTFERLVDGDVSRATIQVPSSLYRIHPGWDGWSSDSEFENDLAILQLPEIAPWWANRHDLYRERNELRQTGTVVGYGNRGNGVDGERDGTFGVKLKGRNFIEFDDYDPGLLVDGSPGPSGTTLAVDLTDDPNLKYEAIGAHGDSGGPLLIGNRIAGVYSTLWGEDETLFDFDFGSNADLDDVGVYMRASHFASWIDGVMTEAHPLGINMNFFPQGNDGDSDVVSVFRNATGFSILHGGTTLYTVPNSQVLSLAITGSNDSEEFHLPADMAVPAFVHGGIGTNILYVRGGSEWTTPTKPFTVDMGGGKVTYNWEGAPAVDRRSIGFAYITEAVARTGSGADTIRVASIANDPMMRVEAGDGADQISVTRIGWYPVTLKGGKGDDTFRLGDTARTLDGLLSNVTIAGDEGTNRLILDDSLDNSRNEFEVKWSMIERNDWTASLANISRFELLAGNGDDDIRVSESMKGLTINAGGGYDSVSLERVDNGRYTVNAGAGGGTLLVDNSAAWYYQGYYSVSDTQVLIGKDYVGTKGPYSQLRSLVDYSGFQRLTVQASDGDDLIRVQTTRASGPRTTVYAGEGHDIVVGGFGDDIIHGENGRDLLIGGDGANTLYGGGQDDILIGGRYTQSHLASDLVAIRTIWTSTKTYATRVAELRPRLKATTIISDAAADSLFGGDHQDWFWGVTTASGSEVKDRQSWDGRWELIR